MCILILFNTTNKKQCTLLISFLSLISLKRNLLHIFHLPIIERPREKQESNSQKLKFFINGGTTSLSLFHKIPKCALTHSIVERTMGNPSITWIPISQRYNHFIEVH